MLRKFMLAALIVGAVPGAGAFQAPISLSLARSRLTSSTSSSAEAGAGAGARGRAAAAPLGLRLALPAKQTSSRRRAAAAASVIVACAEGEPEPAAQVEKLDKFVKTPDSLGEMMVDAGKSVMSAKADGKRRISVEVPLPITGGTELDDWPGGIGQKYQTLRPMVIEMLKTMDFTREEMEARKFLGFVDDAIGVWEGSGGVTVVCFATPEVLDDLQKVCDKEGSTLVLVNHQFFIDPFSPKEAADMIDSMEQAYLLQSLNLKGPGLLPVKGALIRKYPEPFTAARKIDSGEREVIGRFAAKPPRKELEDLFFKDSEERDKNLSFIDRLKKLQQEATNI